MHPDFEKKLGPTDSLLPWTLNLEVENDFPASGTLLSLVAFSITVVCWQRGKEIEGWNKGGRRREGGMERGKGNKGGRRREGGRKELSLVRCQRKRA
jgi:hypothetical protein